MITRIIRFNCKSSICLISCCSSCRLGNWGCQKYSVDALPDLSDVQVIVRTNFPGQAPQIVENQVTYPLTTTMLSVPVLKLFGAILLVIRLFISFLMNILIFTGHVLAC